MHPIRLRYGNDLVPLPSLNAPITVITPQKAPGLLNEKRAMFAALDAPIGAAPLWKWLFPNASICIVFSDITRPTPNERIIPWLLEYLGNHGVTRDQITLLNGTGSHRDNTEEELSRLLTPEVVENYLVVNHDCRDDADLVEVGVDTRTGEPARLNRHYVEADVKIITGFIEPHFFAGYSGGVKGVMPGVAGLATIMSNHGGHHLSSPQATFGVTEGNPLWEELRAIALSAGRAFLLNVTMNDDRAITGVFAGDVLAAHREGAAFVEQTALFPVKERFDIVVASNNGYPLDQNLYQTVKGMTAAARIVKPGGTIIMIARCQEGFPYGGAYEQILRSASSAGELCQRLDAATETLAEQWQAQMQVRAQQKARVLLYSDMPDEDVRAALLEPCHDLAATLHQLIAAAAGHVTVAVLPNGPTVVPYVR